MIMIFNKSQMLTSDLLQIVESMIPSLVQRYPVNSNILSERKSFEKG